MATTQEQPMVQVTLLDKYAAYTRPYAVYERMEMLRNEAVSQDVQGAGQVGDCIFCGAHRQVLGGCCKCCGHDVR